MNDQLIIFDTTLRDGEQSPGASMTRDEKVRIAKVLERSRSVTVPEPAPVFESMASAEGLTAQASTFGRADAIRAVAEALPEGGRRANIEHLADAFLRRSDVIPILPIHLLQLYTSLLL